MILPYAGTAEPIRVYYDGVNNRSRTEYYNGQDITIFRPDMYSFGTQYVLIPETYGSQLNVRSCVQLNGSDGSATTLQSFVPDLTLFKSIGRTNRRGVACEDWLYTFSDSGRSNIYHMYIDAVTQAPVQLHMMGYDFLLGSHYDEYVLNFLTWIPGPINASVFNPPTIPCGNFPGPGAMSLSTRRGALAMVESPLAAEEEVASNFKAFAARHGKTYATAKDQAERGHTFRNNLRYIQSMNRRHMSFSLAINHLADLNEQELRTMRGSKSSPRVGESKEYTPLKDRPASLDWRDSGAVSPVKDQGICGSCWSFATAQTIESAAFIKNKVMIPLAPQALVDCSWGFGNNGCDGGEAERAFGWILQQGGIPTVASYGVYEIADGLCHVAEATMGASISGYVNVTSGNMEAVADAVYQHGPLSIAIDAGHKSFVFYSTGVYFEPQCGSTPDDLDHAVLLIGYGTDPQGGDYWIVKNSWSEYWGDNGYVKMSQKDNNCGVATDTNFVYVSS